MDQNEHPKTLSVPEAGRRYYGISRNAAYRAAARGDIPTVQVGKLLRVPVIQMERKIAGDPAYPSTKTAPHRGQDAKKCAAPKDGAIEETM